MLSDKSLIRLSSVPFRVAPWLIFNWGCYVQVEMLQRMYAKRKSGYRAMGYLMIANNGNSESDMFG